MWESLAILAALCWSIANVIDKTVLTKWVKKPLVPVIITGAIWLIFGIIAYCVNGLSYLSPFNIFLTILTGFLTVLAWIFYFKAMQIEDASRVVPLTNLSQLFVLILAAIFLGEILSPLKYFGVFLLIGGSVLISANNSFKISFGKAFWWITLTAGFYAINTILTKHLLNLTDYWTVFEYKCAGMFIGSLPIAYFFFRDLREAVKQHGKRVIFAISASESLTAIGILLSIIATSIGYVTLVNALSSTQPFFILLLTILLSIFFPKILKEELNKSVIFMKVLAIILIFTGVILIT
jgi:bacterial/archaeal transporter family protein